VYRPVPRQVKKNSDSPCRFCWEGSSTHPELPGEGVRGKNCNRSMRCGGPVGLLQGLPSEGFQDPKSKVWDTCSASVTTPLEKVATIRALMYKQA